MSSNRSTIIEALRLVCICHVSNDRPEEEILAITRNQDQFLAPFKQEYEWNFLCDSCWTFKKGHFSHTHTFVKKRRRQQQQQQQRHRSVHRMEQTRTSKTNHVFRLFSRMTFWLRVPSLDICTSERCRVCDPGAELLLLQALAGGWTAEFLNGHRQRHLRPSSDHCGRNEQPSLSLFSQSRE